MINRRSVLACLVIALASGAWSAHSRAAPDSRRATRPDWRATSRQLLQLAEAPAEKFAWRPAAGCPVDHEVYMHLALGNYYLLERAGAKTGVDLAKLGKEPEKSITQKADVIRLLRESLDAVATGYKTADRQKQVQIFNRGAVADGVFLRILLHNNEHMGQSIAYARMNGIAPPWSQ